MSMLAEPKRKVKWSLNPRGALWSNDDNKWSHKLMEKMGWSKGRGLGKSEDGMVDPIKVTYKCNNKGFGFQENGEAWTAHNDEYEALLQNLGTLNGNSEVKQEASSMESKSKKSRKRIHYHKFIRGKDLSRYSNKDMQCIFGKKDSVFATSFLPYSADDEINENVDTKEETDCHSSIVNGDEKNSDDSNALIEASDESDKTKKQKKRKRHHENSADNSNLVLEENGIAENVTDVDDEKPAKKKRKKSKKNKELLVEDNTETHPDAQIKDEVVTKENTRHKKHKKKQKMDISELTSPQEDTVTEDNSSLSTEITKSKKRHKKKKLKHRNHGSEEAMNESNTISNEDMPIDIEHCDTPSEETKESKKKSKKSKRKHKDKSIPSSDHEPINGICDDISTVNSNIANSNNDNCLDELAHTEASTLEPDSKIKSDKKKKKSIKNKEEQNLYEHWKQNALLYRRWSDNQEKQDKVDHLLSRLQEVSQHPIMRTTNLFSLPGYPT